MACRVSRLITSDRHQYPTISMLILKSLHFTSAAGSAAVYLYTTYFYFEYFNLSKSQVGMLACLTPTISLFSIPLIMHIAESSRLWNLVRSH
jgi:hypothetical protein